jgi:formylglycine-generating enzyme required for sulfatase activity
MLVERSRDAAADLRARIDAGLLLGRLGDPRFERWDGPFGTYLMPPLVEIPGGTYRLGAAAAGDADPELGRAVVLPPFRIGQFPVTNAEWTLFLAAGGYEDERWWDGAAARLWRLGEGTDEAARRRERAIRHWLLVDERRLEQAHEQGRMPRRAYERWLVLLRQSEAEFEEQLVARFPGGRKTTPQYWSDAPFINPAQPVVGICLYEAQAYGMWLAAQTGLPFRPPTEAEWEAAGRGFQRRTYAWGDDYRPFHCNTVEARIRGTTPVGVFPAGDTPEGAADLCGNIHEWTTAVPRPADGARVEDDAAGDDGLVPLHGGSWGEDHLAARLTERVLDHPTIRGNNLGIRLVVSR